MNIQLKDVDNVVFNGIDVSAVKFNDVLVWRKWETVEYTGAVPVEILANGDPLIDYLISGNMQQTGTPSPQSIIMPQETGERTGNLYNNANAVYGIRDNRDSVIKTNTGIIIDIRVSTIQERPYTYIIAPESGYYTLSCVVDESTPLYAYGLTVLSEPPTSAPLSTNNKTVYANSGECICIIFTTVTSDATTYTISNIMLNSGSSALPYEPYGYKIPISSAGQTTPIYLGEVETERKVKKLVLTGEESVGYYNGMGYVRLPDDALMVSIAPFCTHYIGSTLPIDERPNYSIRQMMTGYWGGEVPALQIKDSSLTSVGLLQNFLQQQYAAGTPVTIWYVIAESTTGIVNEPIRKIGDYADTISAAQAGVSIPTVEGTNIIDIDTTLKPSEIYIKYKGKTT